MSQPVAMNDVLAAEQARCERILSGLYRDVKAFSPEGKNLYFAVTAPTDENLKGFRLPSMKVCYLASKLEAKKGATRVEEAQNTVHLVIEASGYQMTYEVHVELGEPLR